MQTNNKLFRVICNVECFFNEKSLARPSFRKIIYLLFKLGAGMRCNRMLARSSGNNDMDKEIGMLQRSAQAPLMAAPTPPKPKVSPSIMPEAIAAFCGKMVCAQTMDEGKEPCRPAPPRKISTQADQDNELEKRNKANDAKASSKQP